jgi:hypothetical protein
MTDDSPLTSRRPHRRTGKPCGGRPGNTNAVFRHGLRSAAFVARRKQVNAILRDCRKFLRGEIAK